MTRKKSPFWTPWPLPSRSNVPYLIERCDYGRAKHLNLHCTQINAKPAEKKRILEEWCEFFSRPSPVRHVHIATRCPQRLFDAVCQRSELESLAIHWGPIEDLEPIRQLKNLTRLRLGSCSVRDLTPLKSVKHLEHLSLENLDRLSDYSALGSLRQLELLQIDGAPFMPKSVWIDDLKFLRKLSKLRGLSMAAVRFHDPNYHRSLRGLPLQWLDFWVKDAELRQLIIDSLPNVTGGRIFKSGD